MTALPLIGQVAIVTGGSRNIGREIALYLADVGCDVVIGARSDQAAAAQVASEIEQRGRRAIVHAADLTNPVEAATLIARAETELGGIDILVCNAAVRRQCPFHEITLEEWREVIDVDLNAAFYCLRQALPRMVRRNYGRVITIGGSNGFRLTPNRGHVVAAKMGLLSLTRTIAIEYGENNITANCVAPGHIDTTRGTSAQGRSGGGEQRPIKRMGTVDEVASMVRYLCLPEASYITGQCIHVNGGMHMAMG